MRVNIATKVPDKGHHLDKEEDSREPGLLQLWPLILSLSLFNFPIWISKTLQTTV